MRSEIKKPAQPNGQTGFGNFPADGRLELIAKRKLQLTLPTLAGDLAEIRAARVGFHAVAARAAPVRVIQPVVSFRTELDAMTFSDEEVLDQGHVVILESGLVNDP